MFALVLCVIFAIAIGGTYLFVQWKKNDVIVQIAVEEKELDGNVFYMIVGVHKSGKRVYLNKKAYTIDDLGSDEVADLINEEINKRK